MRWFAILFLSAALVGCGTRTVTVTTTTVRTVTYTTTVTKVVDKPPAPLVYLPESGGRLLYEPETIVTGVSGGVIIFDKWLSYGGDTARAEARFEIQDCNPNCAQGKTTYVKALVSLSPRVPCNGSLIYEQLYVVRSDDESQVAVGDSVDLKTLCTEGSTSP